MISRLLVQGSKDILDVYCVDLSSRFVMLETSLPSSTSWNTRQRFKARQILDAAKVAKWSDEVHMSEYFTYSLAINESRLMYTRDFIEIFKMGFQNFLEGEWDAAKRILTHTQMMFGYPDGPSTALLLFMQKCEYRPPDNWSGHLHLEILVELLSESSTEKKRTSRLEAKSWETGPRPDVGQKRFSEYSRGWHSIWHTRHIGPSSSDEIPNSSNLRQAALVGNEMTRFIGDRRLEANSLRRDLLASVCNEAEVATESPPQLAKRVR